MKDYLKNKNEKEESNLISSLCMETLQLMQSDSLLKGIRGMQNFFVSLQEKAEETSALNKENRERDDLYARGFFLYKQGDYDRAEQIFRTLSCLFPLEGKYMYAQAAAEQNNEKYKQAISSYWKAVVLDKEQLKAYYYIAECSLQLEKKKEAHLALKLFLKKARGKKEYTGLYRQAKLIAATFKKTKKKKKSA